MRWLLNLVYAAALLLASPWLVVRAIKTGRYRRGSTQKLLGVSARELSVFAPQATQQPEATGPMIWLHGVSVGEVQLLKPLMLALRERIPHARFVISTTTRTGMELAERLFADVARIYFPLDFSWAVRRSLDTVKPDLIILGELELWPNFVAIASERMIPLVVANGRLSERSFRGYRRLAWLTQSMFRKLSLVAAQDAGYAQRFVACGASPARVLVTGSLKFDNVNFDRQISSVVKFRELVGLTSAHQVWLAGSTQAPEERAAAEAFFKLHAQYPNLKLIVVPRHPERFDSVYQELDHLGLKLLRRSQLGSPISADAWHMLLVDTVGELRWWWGLADLALVGGSFGDRGGQNMLEPAAYGADVFFGPNTSNFRDISQLLLAGGGATRLSCTAEILPWIAEQLAQPQPGRVRGEKAQELIRQHQGALARTADAIKKILPTHPKNG